MIFIYDGTFSGLLSAIFESYRLESEVVDIVAEDRYQEELFAEAITINTDEDYARRVVSGMQGRSGNERVGELMYHAFLTEQSGVERLLLHFVRRQVTAAPGVDVSQDAADEQVRRLLRLKQQMGREVHRMHAFVRFQQTADGMYVALVNPDFNCLPLLGDHFAARYPAMPWLIYDTRRHYGLHWDESNKQASFITLDGVQDGRLRFLDTALLDAAETDYQHLWQTYFRAVDIPERRNLKLHLQHVPRRYWKYLTEKT